MTDTGTIERFTIARLLQRLHSEKRSGFLIMKGDGEVGRLAVNRGEIFSASGSGTRIAIRQAYLKRGIATPAQLEEAMGQLSAGHYLDSSVAVLLEAQGISRERIWEAHRQMLQTVVSDFLMWCEGAYAFVPTADFEPNLYAFPIGDFLVDAGQEMFEMRNDLGHLLPKITDDPYVSLFRDQTSEGPKSFLRLLHLMRTNAHEVELHLNLMDIASLIVDRAVLFSVTEGAIQPLSQIEVPRLSERGQNDVEAKLLEAASGAEGLIAEAITTGHPAIGPLRPNLANYSLVDLLGGEVPGNSVALPMVIDGEVRLVLYADVTQGRPPMSTELLECALLQMSLVIENQRLRSQPTPPRIHSLVSSNHAPSGQSNVAAFHRTH